MLKQLQAENARLRQALKAERNAHEKTKAALKEALDDKQAMLSGFRQQTTMYRWKGRSQYSGVSFEALSHKQYATDHLSLSSDFGRRCLGGF